jgi:hypothetical protein
MSETYQDSNADGSSFIQGDISWLEESQVLIHQELKSDN